MSKYITLPNGHLAIEDAKLNWRNFSGIARNEFDNEGERKFTVRIDEFDEAERLKADGWNIKPYISKNDPNQEIQYYYMDVKVSYKYTAPFIELIGSRNTQNIIEENATIVDRTDLAKVILEVSPSHWTMKGRSGVTAYLFEFHGYIAESYFDSAYGRPMPEAEELPFN